MPEGYVFHPAIAAMLHPVAARVAGVQVHLDLVDVNDRGKGGGRPDGGDFAGAGLGNRERSQAGNGDTDGKKFGCH